MYIFHFDKEPRLVPKDSNASEAKLVTDCDISNINFSDESMDGSFTFSKTGDNFYFLFINVQVHKEINLCIKNMSLKQGMHLFYNMGGCLALTRFEKKQKLPAEKLSIGMSEDASDFSLLMPENTAVKLVLIQTDFMEIVDDNFCGNASLPANISKAKNGFYQKYIQKKTLNGEMRGLINKCLTNTQEGLERKMNLEAHCKELTALALGTIGKYRATYDNTAAVLNSRERESIHAVAKILEEKFDKPPIQTTLAKEVGLNLNKLSSGFKLVYGQTINKYLLKIRMAKAKSLLVVDNELTVTDVAEAVGFSNASYFIKKFKETYGETPGEFV